MTRCLSGGPEVAIVYKTLPHYRVDFYEGLRARLAANGLRLRLIVGQPDSEMAKRNDTARIQWAEGVRNRYVRVGSRHLVWQPALGMVRTSDLVIVEQASKLLVNYPLLAWRRLGGPKVAWWGHGSNLDTANASSLGERVKRLLATRADWWFCYTAGTAGIVHALGVPHERLTVVQNAIDTSQLSSLRALVSEADISEVRVQLGLGTGPVALALGSLYPTKRPEFLIEAADTIRMKAPDFHLIVIGDGPGRTILDAASSTRPWLHVLGAKMGNELVRIAAAAAIVLNPGLVGLAVLDAFALGLPMITCDLPYHSPEFEYLENGVNGVVLDRQTSPEDFGLAALELMSDRAVIESLQAGCRISAAKITVDQMIERFATG
ncbi:MAG: hypothetical protein RLZZ623_3435, partial [Actinomycetota bacterium]